MKTIDFVSGLNDCMSNPPNSSHLDEVMKKGKKKPLLLKLHLAGCRSEFYKVDGCYLLTISPLLEQRAFPVFYQLPVDDQRSVLLF